MNDFTCPKCGAGFGFSTPGCRHHRCGTVTDFGRKVMDRGRACFIAEINKLTQALHAKRCHPDYSYQVAPAGNTLLGQSGFERNLEAEDMDAEVAGRDWCWRRKREA